MHPNIKTSCGKKSAFQGESTMICSRSRLSNRQQQGLGLGDATKDQNEEKDTATRRNKNAQIVENEKGEKGQKLNE